MKISSLNISKEKGVIKTPVKSIELNETGIKNDAHAGNWHRQVSILGSESIEKFSGELGRVIKPGEFAENITLQGLGLTKVRPLDKFVCGDVELEVTQIGKKCHGANCVIFRETGNCVMPKEGIFCRVLKSGTLKTGDELIFQPKEDYVRQV
jgi:MOSC domain-containing protein YiiM